MISLTSQVLMTILMPTNVATHITRLISYPLKFRGKY